MSESEWVNCHQEESKGGRISFFARRGEGYGYSMSTLFNLATEFYLLVITLATNRPLSSGPALSTLSLCVRRVNQASCEVLCDVTRDTC